jgi:hypothetical protein
MKGEAMNIDELREERRNLENSIREKVTDDLARFHLKTGLSPSFIDIQMVETTKIGDKKKSYIVGYVDIKIDL